VPFASLDNARGGRLAAEHLLSLGARRIAFVGGLEGRSVTEERMAGYLEAMRQRGLAVMVLPGRATRAFGRDAAGVLVERGVEAAMCFNDLVALGLLSGFLARGVEVGRQVRVVGYDDIEECGMSVPRLSSVRSDVAGFGRQVAATLLSWIEEGVEPPPETRRPVSLVARESSLGR
jgi:LacI family transcriptional regulator